MSVVEAPRRAKGSARGPTPAMQEIICINVMGDWLVREESLFNPVLMAERQGTAKLLGHRGLQAVECKPM